MGRTYSSVRSENTLTEAVDRFGQLGRLAIFHCLPFNMPCHLTDKPFTWNILSRSVVFMLIPVAQSSEIMSLALVTITPASPEYLAAECQIMILSSLRTHTILNAAVHSSPLHKTYLRAREEPSTQVNPSQFLHMRKESQLPNLNHIESSTRPVD